MNRARATELNLAHNGAMRIDLHTHSTCSDGTDTASELMHLARQTGLDLIALTDHDTISGWEEAAAEVSSSGVGLLRGAEFSTSHDLVTAHVLGYLFDPTDLDIHRLFKEVKQARVARLQEMTRRLAKDYALTWNDVLDQAAPGVAIGRPHLADALIAKGYFENRNQVFASVLQTSSPYYVHYQAVDTFEAVRVIRKAGGVAVLAHPRARHRQRRFLSGEDIGRLAEQGLFGVEGEHPEQDLSARFEVAEIAQRYGLALTGASDYHGRGKNNRLGECLTSPEVVYEIEKRAVLPLLWP